MDSLQLAYAAVAVAALALLLSIWAVVQLSRAKGQLRVLRGSNDESDLLAAAVALADRLDEVTGRVGRLSLRLDEVQTDVAASLRHLAVVRFNALSDMGGQFSFAAAILDDAGNGIVLTSIQGHNHGRLYGKSITAGQSDTPLSPEEIEAIKNARPVELS